MVSSHVETVCALSKLSEAKHHISLQVDMDELDVAAAESKVIAVYHRLNDNEDKWIVSLSGETIQTEDILKAISFQEQYFLGELYTL